MKKAKSNKNKFNDIELELLQANHLEHFKFEKDLSMIFHIDHPKRIKLRKITQELSDKIQNIKKA